MNPTHTRKIVLFDIDGTLIRSGGAGLRALANAFGEVFGLTGGLEGVSTAGRIDPAIVDDVLAAAGIEGTPDSLRAFRESYFDGLRRELGRPADDRRVLPGVEPLLAQLAGRADVAVGLLTGNFATSARIKLEHFELARFFAWGAYGDDGPTRNALLPVALRRAATAGFRAARPADVLVIGDTPHDVEVARVHRATSLAVATGVFTRNALNGTGADIVVDDLADAAPVYDWLAEAPGSRTQPPRQAGSDRF